MQTHLYKNDLDNGIVFKGNVAIDTEAMGLDPARDRLCLIQIFDGETDCHMVQFENSNVKAPNLTKLLNEVASSYNPVLLPDVIFIKSTLEN